MLRIEQYLLSLPIDFFENTDEIKLQKNLKKIRIPNDPFKKRVEDYLGGIDNELMRQYVTYYDN
jgi:hypothetical protein